MKIMVEYLAQEKRSGRYQYRRRVPKELKEALGKGEIVVSLRTVNLEVALREHARIHAEVESRLAMLSSTAPELAAYDETIRLLRDAKIVRRGAERAEPFGSSTLKQKLALKEFIEAQAAKMTEEELNGPLNQAPMAVRRVLRAAQVGLEKPEVRLRDALALYLKEKTDEYNERRQRLDSERVVAALEEIVGEKNPALVDLTKDDGYAFRDFWIDRGNSPDTARRRLNTINAMVNLSIKRQDIRHFNNPFSGIEIKGAGKGRKDKVVALTVEELQMLQPFVDKMRDQDAKDIWTLMIHTGARPGELATLAKADLIMSAPVPHILIRGNSIWRVKTDSSDRSVPVVGAAFEICQRRLGDLSERSNEFPVFRSYGRPRGADALSQAFNKMMRRAGVHENRRKVPYSVRHAHKDWMRRVTSELHTDLVHGHTDGRASRDYGSDRMLDLLRDDILKALRTAGVIA